MPTPRIIKSSQDDPVFSPSEVAAMFHRHERTITRWTEEGKFGPEGIGWIRTPGGHRRFRQSAINALKLHIGDTVDDANGTEEASSSVVER